MKKLFFAMGLFTALSFAACGGSTEAGGANDTDSVAVDTLVEEVVEVADTLVADTMLAE
jgi:hypothetical protein